ESSEHMLINYNNSKQPDSPQKQYLNIWQNSEEQGVNLQYQSKNTGEQVFTLTRDSLGNLTIRVTPEDHLRWWQGQDSYFRKALMKIGYPSFKIEIQDLGS
ncbi:MAG: hypothetical protein WD512_18790, partial [Candidatus Paceibacterota bacterium]